MGSALARWCSEATSASRASAAVTGACAQCPLRSGQQRARLHAQRARMCNSNRGPSPAKSLHCGAGGGAPQRRHRAALPLLIGVARAIVGALHAAASVARAAPACLGGQATCTAAPPCLSRANGPLANVVRQMVARSSSTAVTLTSIRVALHGYRWRGCNCLAPGMPGRCSCVSLALHHKAASAVVPSLAAASIASATVAGALAVLRTGMWRAGVCRRHWGQKPHQRVLIVLDANTGSARTPALPPLLDHNVLRSAVWCVYALNNQLQRVHEA